MCSHAKTNSSNSLLEKWAVTAVCICRGLHPMKCRAKASSSNCLLEKKRLLLFVFELQDSLLPSSTDILTAMQRQTAVTAHLKSKQLLLFFFAGSCSFTQIKRSKSMPSRPRLLFPCKMTPAHWPDHQCFPKVCNLVCLNATSGGCSIDVSLSATAQWNK